MNQLSKRLAVRLAQLTKTDWLASGIVLAFVLLGLLYSVTVPSWEAPDEVDHFKYARYLQTHFALPVQGPHAVATAHHPPLFYVLAALVSWPVDMSDGVGEYRANRRFLFDFRGGQDLNRHQQSTGDTFPYAGMALAVHLMRWLSLAFGAGTVWLTYKLVCELMPERAWLACFAAALVAFNPQFLFISAAAMNDSLSAFNATGLFWSLARAARQPAAGRRWAVVGIWTALAALSKISGLAFMPLGVLLLLAFAVRQRSIQFLLRNGVALGVPMAVLTGWWFVRNTILYGDVLGDNAWMQRFPEAIRQSPVNWPATFMQLFRSFWGIFGWMTMAAPEWYFVIIWFIQGVGIIGVVAYFYKQARQPGRAEFAVWGILGCLLLVAYQLGLIVRENILWTTASQGRYLFPVIAPIMILLSLGWTTLLSDSKVERYATNLPAAVLFGLALFLPLAVIGPNFRMHQTLPRSRVWFARHAVYMDFGDQLGLRAYEVETPQPTQLHVKLYWSALTQPRLNYSSFAHVLRASDPPAAKLLGQQDQVPGANSDYTPASWHKADLVLDERDIQLAAPVAAGDYVIRLGVYDYTNGARLPVQPADSAPDYVLLKFSVPLN